MKLIKLGKEGCRPCKMVEEYLQSEEVEYEDIDIQANVDLATKYGIMSVPVTILLDDEGNEVERVQGFNPPAIEKLIEQLN